MIQFNKALNNILSQAKQLPAEQIQLLNALNRVLAEDIKQDIALPPFNKSSMDGYACRRSDLKNELTVVETIHAGKEPEKEIKQNECAKIMTGAVVPNGADCVFMIEDAVITEPNKVACLNQETKTNICYKGEDVQSGDVILKKSTLLTAKHIPMLAGAGITVPKVFTKPNVAVFSSGTELVEPYDKPKTFQIRNSNAFQIISQLQEIGIRAEYKGIVKDDAFETGQQILQSIGNSNVIISTGGVSVGDFDLIPGILKKNNFEILISSTAIKPGKPMTFARNETIYYFGLSGNPVSSFIQFEFYVKPFLYKLMGHDFETQKCKFPISTDYSRNKCDRLLVLPANIVNNCVEPVKFNGSAHIHALSKAKYLFEIPVGVSTLKKGDLVDVRPI